MARAGRILPSYPHCGAPAKPEHLERIPVGHNRSLLWVVEVVDCRDELHLQISRGCKFGQVALTRVRDVGGKVLNADAEFVIGGERHTWEAIKRRRWIDRFED